MKSSDIETLVSSGDGVSERKPFKSNKDRVGVGEGKGC